VLVDLPALHKAGQLESCLQWLLRYPQLRAVRITGAPASQQCCMLSEAEAQLLIQLVVAYPSAAKGVQGLGIYTAQLQRQFDAGGWTAYCGGAGCVCAAMCCEALAVSP